MKREPRTSAALLRKARLSSSLSQSDVARRAHVAQSVISAYESGRREPALSTLERLVAATGHHLVLGLQADPDVRPGLPDTPLGRRLRQRRTAVLATARRHGASNVRVFGTSLAAKIPSRATSTCWSTWPRAPDCCRWAGSSGRSPTSSAPTSTSPLLTACGQKCGLKLNLRRSNYEST